MTDVHLARADYQERVETEAPLERPDRLRVAPFPSYPPPTYGSDYAGFKVFPLEGRLCVAHYADEGRTDDVGRPVLTATVAMLDREAFETAGRDVVLVRDFLRGHGADATAASFEAYHEGAATVAGESTFRRVSERFDRGFLSDALGSLLAGGDVRVRYDDRERAVALVRLAWSLLPWPLLSSTSVVTDCNAPGREDAEDAVLDPASGRAAGRGDQRGAADGEVVDVVTGSAPDRARNPLVEAVLTSLLDGPEWYDHEWTDRRRVLLDHLAGVYAGDGRTPFDRSEALAAMAETVAAVRDLEEAAGDDGWLP